MSLSDHEKKIKTLQAKGQVNIDERFAHHEVKNEHGVFCYDKLQKVISGRLTTKEKNLMRKEIKDCISWCKENNVVYDQYIEMKIFYGL
jgi:hypothetical protein